MLGKPATYLAVLFTLGLSTLNASCFEKPVPAAPKLEWKDRDSAMKQIQQKLQGLADQIQSAQGKGACDSDLDCRTIGIGAKVCDLYKDFLIYSSKDADERKLLGLVSDFNSLHQKLVDMSLAANNCGIKPTQVYCDKSNRCTQK